MNVKKDKAAKRSEQAKKIKKIPISAEDFLRKIGRMYSEYATEDIRCHMEPDFRYNWDRKSVSHQRYDGTWHDWDINRDNCHADGQPFIPNTAETAFVAAYNMRFYNETMGYHPVLKEYYRVIGEEFYRTLGI